jgi:hypothetical protein
MQWRDAARTGRHDGGSRTMRRWVRSVQRKRDLRLMTRRMPPVGISGRLLRGERAPTGGPFSG